MVTCGRTRRSFSLRRGKAARSTTVGHASQSEGSLVRSPNTLVVVEADIGALLSLRQIEQVMTPEVTELRVTDASLDRLAGAQAKAGAYP